MEAIRDIENDMKTAASRGSPYASSGKAVFIQLDLASLESIKAFADQFNHEFSYLDILVNNGGINTASVVNGMQQLFAVNYLGHFFLFTLMQPALASTSRSTTASTGTASTTIRSGRVVNLSSVTHHTGSPDFKASCYSSHGRSINSLWEGLIFMLNKPSYYSDSKFYLNLLTISINKKYGLRSGTTTANTSTRPITSISVNPGAVRSDIWRSVPWFLSVPYDMFMRCFFLDTTQGAAPSLFAATISDDELMASPSQGTYRRCSSDDASSSVSSGVHLLPYVTPYMVWGGLLAGEMIAPFAGPHWCTPSIPTRITTTTRTTTTGSSSNYSSTKDGSMSSDLSCVELLADELWDFSTLLVSSS
jgi:NAD(P)-dependent dehydrogenase (short-subunit alcohol dehydrogenase family)